LHGILLRELRHALLRELRHALLRELRHALLRELQRETCWAPRCTHRNTGRRDVEPTLAKKITARHVARSAVAHKRVAS
jgi:hypothetical protein